MSIFKYFKLFAGLKDVRAIVKEESGKDAPVWMSRKVIGAVLVFISTLVLYFTGIQIDPDIIVSLTDNLEKLTSAGVAMYGIVMVLVSVFKNK